MTAISNVSLHHRPASQTFMDDVVCGLSQRNKELNCKYFYDEAGSKLFDQICDLDEYYLTRTELAIMRQHAPEMAEQLGREIALVEFGSGSSVKTKVLLDQLCEPTAYMPLDISEEHLLRTANGLRSAYPDIEIIPIVADFTEGFQLPTTRQPYSHAAVYFPGSTIGNFTPAMASQMLRRIADVLGQDGGLLIGIDLQKDSATIEAAYNDAKGVTQEFILNVLHRINRELNADIDVDQFRYKAVYNQEQGRVEMSVVCQDEVTIQIGEYEIVVGEGEEIMTEFSHKYTVDGFSDLAADAGFSMQQHWTDEQDYFAVLHLVHENGRPTRQT